MHVRKRKDPSSRKTTSQVHFRLYISGNSASSIRARANLQTICDKYFPHNSQVEVIDTLREPERAMADGIVLTPTLVKISPEPAWTVVGDLSEDARTLMRMNER